MNFSEYINDIAPINTEEEDFLSVYFKRVEFKKGERLFSEGERCQKFYFLETGLARIFYYSQSGKDITAWFCDELSAVTDFNYYQNNEIASNNCELLEDSVLYEISFSDLENLINESRTFSKIAFHFFSKATSDIVGSVSTMKFKTAKQKYNSIVQKNPKILQRVSLFQIASYIGVTPETVSRLRVSTE